MEFIDIGAFGVWGEGHTSGSTGIPYNPETIYRLIDLYCKYFKETQLVISDDVVCQGRGLEILRYARKKGVSLRDDSILVNGEYPWYHDYQAGDFWRLYPVVLESQHYGPAKDNGNWGDGSRYLEAIEAYHASFASVHWYPREFLRENRELVDRINLRLGYRLQLLEISWPEEVRREEPLSVGYRWRNAGVAPCYPGGFPAITLKDEKGGIVGVFVDEGFDMRDLPVGPPGEAKPVERRANVGFGQGDKDLVRFRIPPQQILKAGTYDLYISVGSRTGTPVIALPLEGEDGHLRYLLGKITINE